jgi:hypothetical protein
MTNSSRWSLVVVAIALSGLACLRIPTANKPAAINKPSATVQQTTVGAGVQVISVHNAEPIRARPIIQNWMVLFQGAASNYYEFVTLAARAAYEGDGAAQYYIGRALARCNETNALYRDADSADEAVSRLAYSPALLELERLEYLDCGKFRSGNAFKGLPERPQGYPADYWRSRAVVSRYPVAVVMAARDSPGKYGPQLIATALASGNTEAMLLFGWTQIESAKAADQAPIMAAAWALAACRSGANCGPTNDALPLSPCRAGIELGCTKTYTVVDELMATLSVQDFEQANLLAQGIQTSMRYRDPARLMEYLAF